MRKKGSILSVALVFAMLLSVFAVSATAAETDAVDSQANVSVSSGADNSSAVFSWDNATVYFLLTDRFENGNPSNDHSYGRGLDGNGNEIDFEKSAAFQGGDFQGITDKINDGYFNDLGVNAIWLSAPYEQVHGYVLGGNGDPTYPHYAYHGYYVLDYTESDKNFGSKEEFKTMVDTAHEHGIRIVLDIVMNHSGYQSIYDMDEYNFGALNSGWESYYYAHQRGVGSSDYHSKYINYGSDTANLWAKWWGPDWIRCGLPGYTEGNGEIEGCLASLPDFKTGSSQNVGIPEFLKNKWTSEGSYDAKINKYGSSNTVSGYISDWLAEWVREYGVDGFRCDTAKHVELNVWKALKDKCVNALKEWKSKNPDKKLDDLDFWMTGECFGHQVAKSQYFTQGGFDSMINFEFAPAAGSSAIPQAGSVQSVYERYASSINSDDSFNVLSYIASHDTTLAQGDRKYAGSFLLMIPGGVQIYYGDETNRPQVSVPSDSDAGAGHMFRSFMNWNSIDQGVLDHWQKVGQFRNNHIAVGAGSHETISSYDSNNGYSFARTYSKNGVDDTIVATLFASANKDITVDVSSVWGDGMTVVNAYDDSTAVVSGGKVTFNSGANGTILMQAPSGGALVSVSGSASFKDTQEVTLKLDGVDSAKVSVDGAKKFIANNGDTFTIGETAYPGDTVKVSVSYTNEDGSPFVKTFSFKKEDDGQGGGSRSDKGIVHVYSENLSGMNLYAWQGDGDTAKQLTGAWPGTALSEKDADGWYVYDLSVKDKYNIIINTENGGVQSDDTTGLQGETWVIASGGITLKTYTDRIEALKAAGVEINDNMSLLKKACRTFKNLTASEYKSSTYNPLRDEVVEADKLIAKGGDADESAVESELKKIQDLQSKLVLAAPVVTSMSEGSTVIKGKAACEAEVVVKIGSSEYKATADDITGEWSVTVPSISSSTTANITAQNAVAKSNTITATPGNLGTDTDDNTDSDDTDTDTNTDTDTDTTTDTDTDTDDPIRYDMGDVDMDGKITLKDASRIQRHTLELEEFSNEQKALADVNEDGRITLKDASFVQRQVLIGK